MEYKAVMIIFIYATYIFKFNDPWKFLFLIYSFSKLR